MLNELRTEPAAGRDPGREDLFPVEPVTAPAAIALLLKRLLDGHCLLTVRVGEEATSYLSAIIEMVHEHGYFVLDELVPGHGHQALLADPRIDVRTRLDGVPVRFLGVVNQISESGGVPYYMVPFPDRVDYAQRRREHRVIVPVTKHVSVTIANDAGDQITGELRDISPGGFNATIVTGNMAAVTVDRRRRHCKIELPHERTVVGRIDIRHASRREGRQPPCIGALFVALEPREQRWIERFVAELDREQVRSG